MPGRPDGLALHGHLPHGRRAAFLPDADRVGDDRSVLPPVVKQPHGCQVDHDSFSGGLGKDEHQGQNHAASGLGRPDVHARVGRADFVIAETEVSCDVRQGIAVLNADHGQPADDLIAFRGGEGARFDGFFRSSRFGPKESHLRRRSTGMKEKSQQDDNEQTRPQDVEVSHKGFKHSFPADDPSFYRITLNEIRMDSRHSDIKPTMNSVSEIFPKTTDRFWTRIEA